MNPAAVTLHNAEDRWLARAIAHAKAQDVAVVREALGDIGNQESWKDPENSWRRGHSASSLRSLDILVLLRRQSTPLDDRRAQLRLRAIVRQRIKRALMLRSWAPAHLPQASIRRPPQRAK